MATLINVVIIHIQLFFKKIVIHPKEKTSHKLKQKLSINFKLGDVYAILRAVLALLGSLSGGFPSLASEILGYNLVFFGTAALNAEDNSFYFPFCCLQG